MADRILKPDSGNDLVLQNDDGSGKIEINEAGTIVHTGTSSIDVSGGTFTTSSAQKQAIVNGGQTNQLVPSNLVAYRASGESIPSGWSEYESVRGRMIVGLPSGGTDGGTVGTALINTEDKTHSHTGPSHSHQMGYGVINEFAWKVPHEYGTSGTFTFTSYSSRISPTPWSIVNSITNTGGTGATGNASTSDVLAYIQLMAIKKD